MRQANKEGEVVIRGYDYSNQIVSFYAWVKIIYLIVTLTTIHHYKYYQFINQVF